jgi:hypothetical protein
MKNQLLLLLIFTGINLSKAQTIPNAGFENWHPYINGVYPDNWTTDDSISANNSGGKSVYDSSDAYEGSKCMHLRSVQIILFGSFPVKGPGIATNGVISINAVAGTINFSGGSQDSSRSKFFTARYKYYPAATNDSAIIYVYKFKYDAANNRRDTIADGTAKIGGLHDNYELLDLPLTYHYWDSISIPDTCLIIFQSSLAINDPNIGVGTELVIDSLNFSGYVGIDELKSAITKVSVYPSPANEQLNIDVSLKNNISLSYEIFDISGKCLKRSLMNSAYEKVDVRNLVSGKYILKIGDAKFNQLYSTGFSILK